MFRTTAQAAFAALALTAAVAGNAQATDRWNTQGLTLVDAYGMSNAGPDGATVTKQTRTYRGAHGRTVTITKTRTTHPVKVFSYNGGHQTGDWTPKPQVYPEYDPNWTPPAQAYPEYDPNWTPAPLAYPEHDPNWKPASRIHVRSTTGYRY